MNSNKGSGGNNPLASLLKSPLITRKVVKAANETIKLIACLSPEVRSLVEEVVFTDRLDYSQTVNDSSHFVDFLPRDLYFKVLLDLIAVPNLDDFNWLQRALVSKIDLTLEEWEALISKAQVTDEPRFETLVMELSYDQQKSLFDIVNKFPTKVNSSSTNDDRQKLLEAPNLNQEPDLSDSPRDNEKKSLDLESEKEKENEDEIKEKGKKVKKKKKKIHANELTRKDVGSDGTKVDTEVTSADAAGVAAAGGVLAVVAVRVGADTVGSAEEGVDSDGGRRICMYYLCGKPEPIPYSFRACGECVAREMESPKFYCTPECQKFDWHLQHSEYHKAEKKGERDQCLLDVDGERTINQYDKKLGMLILLKIQKHFQNNFGVIEPKKYAGQ